MRIYNLFDKAISVESPSYWPELGLCSIGEFTALTAFGFAAEKTKIGQSLSGAAIILSLAMLLSNIGILPISANVYDVVWEFKSVSLLKSEAFIRIAFIDKCTAALLCSW